MATDKTFVVGTKRKRTELDEILDAIVLENYYERNPEEKAPEKDQEIIQKSYLMQKDD